LMQSGAAAPHSKTWPSCGAQFALASCSPLDELAVARSAALPRRFGFITDELSQQSPRQLTGCADEEPRTNAAKKSSRNR
jgi:hypothetical protein